MEKKNGKQQEGRGVDRRREVSACVGDFKTRTTRVVQYNNNNNNTMVRDPTGIVLKIHLLFLFSPLPPPPPSRPPVTGSCKAVFAAATRR